MICDGQTVRRTDARGKTICLPTHTGGDIIIRILLIFICKPHTKFQHPTSNGSFTSTSTSTSTSYSQQSITDYYWEELENDENV